jgi:hypothetical protein
MSKKELEKKVKEQNLKEEFNMKNSEVTINSEEEKINFEELVVFLKKYIKGEYSEEAYENLLKKLNIKPYLKMEAKAQLLIAILIDIKYSNNFISEIATVDLEMKKLFKGLLAYTDVDTFFINYATIEFETFDLFYQSGLVDDILKVCEKDYERLDKMIRQAVSFEGIVEANTLMANIQPKEMDKAIKNATKFMQGFDNEALDKLAKIATLQDPIVNDIAKIIENGMAQ